MRHFDENGKELTVHKFNDKGQLVHAEVVVAEKKPNYKKDENRPTPADMGPKDHKGHVGPEVHMPDQRAANTPENILAEHQKSNQGPKRQFENSVPRAVKNNPNAETRTVHDYTYPPDGDSKRPSESSHGVTQNGKRLPAFDSGPIPNNETAKSR